MSQTLAEDTVWSLASYRRHLFAKFCFVALLIIPQSFSLVKIFSLWTHNATDTVRLFLSIWLFIVMNKKQNKVEALDQISSTKTKMSQILMTQFSFLFQSENILFTLFPSWNHWIGSINLIWTISVVHKERYCGQVCIPLTIELGKEVFKVRTIQMFFKLIYDLNSQINIQGILNQIGFSFLQFNKKCEKLLAIASQCLSVTL